MVNGNRYGIVVFLFLLPFNSNGQELEARAYAALPKNMHAVIFIYTLAKGNILTDPSLPVNNFRMTTHTFIAGYLHTFGIANKLARVQMALPYTFLSGSLQINGRDTSGTRNGWGDARIRIGINLTGSPPLDKKDFRQYSEKTIFGVSLVTSMPIGTYVDNYRINMGSHRWGFKPEAGISKRFGKLYAELYGGVWFYTDNNNFLGKKTLQQNPVFNMQAHASYFFRNRMMVSANTVWFNGGETTVDGIAQGKLLNSWRVGATWSVPVARRQSIKLQFHVGAFTTSGYDYSAISLAYLNIF